ncbi:MAG: hypothetical protein KAT68_00855 [Bacteroidales bacterium]|nr:hypothetical protein [Bacteroidales bacterium]
MIKIITEYPAWLIIICLVISFLYSFFLYRKDKHFTELKLWKLRLLSILRFIVVFLISFFLLSPIIRSVTNKFEKPIIIFAQDNSVSIKLNKDSLYYKNEYPNQIKKMLESLSKDYEIATYSFGDEINNELKFDYNKLITNYSKLFDEIENRYYNRNTGAIIIASDGIYNKGTNPVYSVPEINFPVFTIALGDTNIKKDIILSEVNYNKIAFLNDNFPIRIRINAFEFDGIETLLEIVKDNKVIYSNNITITGNSYSETIDVELSANKTGIQKYHIRVIPVSEEASKTNNYNTIAIDIIDSKQKILVLYNSPHPDVGAIQKSLGLNQNLELDIKSIYKFKASAKDYNLVILHQLPSATKSLTGLIKDIFEDEIPVLFIVGSQSSLLKLNNLKAGINIRQNKNLYEEILPDYNNKFSIFNIDEDVIKSINDYPPLICPFGEYKADITSEILFYQKIRNISTKKPLISLHNNSGHKTGFIMGEGIWRWRMQDYIKNNNQDYFNEIINKIVQYLALKVKKERFVVNTENILNENEYIIFDCELYNENYELINKPDVNLEIINENGKKFNYIFNKVNKAYRINTGVFPQGNYLYQAKVNFGDKLYNKSGQFTVLPVNVEAQNILADHKLLFQLANKNSGKYYLPSNMSGIIDDIKKNNEIKPVLYSKKKLENLLNLKWIFFLILILISTEWFLRKYYGSY